MRRSLWFWGRRLSARGGLGRRRQGTFKAFTKDDAKGLVVLPFSGWSPKFEGYNNGLQLIEFTSTSIQTAGTAKTHGWVERGIFVKNRLVSLSDLALSVVDYTNKKTPTVVAELTLARNVVDARPHGDQLAMLSGDWWWENDQQHSELRQIPTEPGRGINRCGRRHGPHRRNECARISQWLACPM